MPSAETILLRIVLSAAIGAIIGAEREYRNKSAGFRTIMLISLGSCLFTIFSALISPGTPDRVASNIVTGIGFLGAGVIFKGDNRVNGLTTAATIWATAAMGMGIGAGYYLFAITGCLLAILILILLNFLEHVIDKLNQTRNYTIICIYDETKIKHYESRLRQNRLRFKRLPKRVIGNELTCSWIAEGTESNHESFVKETLQDSAIKEFQF